MADSVRIVEVAPRDGLQNEAVAVSVATKLDLIRQLRDAGLAAIEVGSFVSPKRVPQMADTDEVVRQLNLDGGVRYPVLVPNEQGMVAALAAGVREIAVFASASETFSQKNINCSIEQSIDRFRPVVEMAKANHVAVRGYVSCVLGCPYEVKVAMNAVVSVSRKLAELGCYEISLGDTIGIGTPWQARDMVRAVAGELDIATLAAHFHDTRGQALANILACLEEGVSVVDSAVGGLGGCPYAPGAAGNVSTEDLAFMLDGLGIHTGVDLSRVVAAGQFISAALGKTSRSKVAQSMCA
ncbi:hydroxymethylglutaryl-CoA lyase [Tianweitania populi]|uniref:hydroxymethylglutaryl-CoA lyase n=1 Tax=Tianweitania populi TaxID=1607949 RepID=A0A8J3DSW7_9HYPH|nr:hydroxymethylglutaryl-CoA lyase [Tianweitania populi]GHD21699.1 hydroxymethylglutaryl-CoA lyase [Tianweitania populi]